MKNLFKSGDIFLWFTGAVLGMIMFLVAGLLLIVSLQGVGVFWPGSLAEVELKDGRRFAGEIMQEESIPLANVPDAYKEEVQTRIQMKTGNRDIYGLDFKWLNTYDIASLQYPDDFVIIERREFGNFYGRVASISENGTIIASGAQATETLDQFLRKALDVHDEQLHLEKGEGGPINRAIEDTRLEIKRLKFYKEDTPELLSSLEAEIHRLQEAYQGIQKQLETLHLKTSGMYVSVITTDGQTRDLPVSKIVRFYQPNTMNTFEKSGFYISKIFEYLTDEPRESNTEGGVFPAIFGTVLMVFLMNLVVVPFGVVAALYLREYAKQGIAVRLIRIAVNNLAGVPSIVFGIFGLGFFVYFCGGTIDQLFYPDRLPTPTWGTGGILWASLTLSLLTVPVVIVATEEALTTVPKGVRDASLALGATKWQTTWRVVIPASTPGILTGVILAMARGAGEVAPLMITGVVKLAPNLPLDGSFPFFHLDRKFMHLGFHIYDVGFQSPNVESAKPMVFMTALLLITIVLLLNLTAIIVRARLRKKYQGSAF